MSSQLIRRPAVETVPVQRLGSEIKEDLVVVEDPLEIRIENESIVVTMRTPGYEDELAAGFLYAEGIISGRSDIASIQPRIVDNRSKPSQLRMVNFSGDHVDVALSKNSPNSRSTAVDPDAASSSNRPNEISKLREFAATAACGVCGKTSIDELDHKLPSVNSVACDVNLLESLPDRLRQAQTLFDITGGIHAAAIFDLNGRLLCLREDIGRHNAVDKVIGHFVLRNRIPLSDTILAVSGRAGFELVQKALKAEIPAMVSVGAASSVAVDMATTAGMTLYSFAGRGRGNLHMRLSNHRDPNEPLSKR